MIELERTFLAKYLPKALEKSRSEEIIDLYVPKDGHAILRVRKKGNSFEITKKKPVSGTDSSRQEERTIPLTKEEWEVLSAVDGKKLHKIRYFYPWKGKTAEIDVFLGPLKGLILVDVEFSTEKEKSSFKMPNFCLADVTQELFAAGGNLSGKSYGDIEEELKKFGYVPLSLEKKK